MESDASHHYKQKIFYLEQKINIMSLDINIKIDRIQKNHQAQINSLILENRNLVLRLNSLENKKKKGKSIFGCLNL